jgi:S-adenosylmethionine synthetase
MARPLAVSLDTFDTATVDDDALLRAVKTVFDLRPGAIIRELDLRRPIFAATAAYGHFGRTDIDAPWERTNKVEALRAHVQSDRTAATTAT